MLHKQPTLVHTGTRTGAVTNYGFGKVRVRWYDDDTVSYIPTARMLECGRKAYRLV